MRERVNTGKETNKTRWSQSVRSGLELKRNRKGVLWLVLSVAVYNNSI